MPTLALKPTHKAVTAYYEALAKFESLGVKHEGAVSSAFEDLLLHCARLADRVLIPKYALITSDPNRKDDEEYILRLIGHVITVSLETMKVVKSLPPL
jgi:hypothetical protein